MKNKVDILIKGGTIIDGTGGDPFEGDIAIAGDTILSIGTFRESDAGKVVHAKGLCVAPGFIDAHAHSDFTLLADPRAEGKILQGVTTEINGNCGMSAAPLYGSAFERREDDLRELAIRERWHTMAEYRMLIAQRGIALNSAVLAGHGNVRGSVVGYENRQPTLKERAEMAGLLENAVREGAIGLSTGLIYPPGMYADTDELADLCSVLKRHELPYTSHMRSEGTALLESISEIITIGQRAGVSVHISHLKTSGKQNWHKANDAVSMIEDARQKGIRLTCDRYPYVASSTDLDSLLPPWAFEGGNEQELERILCAETRRQLRAELLTLAGDAAYWEGVIIASVMTDNNRWMEGRSIAAIGAQRGTDAAQTILDILSEERLRVVAIFRSMSEDNLRQFLSLPYCAIGSDSSARSLDGPTRRGKPHPRTFGTFARFIGKYARDYGLMPLAMAVHKMTRLPAAIFGLHKRGQLKRGMYADMTIFDPGGIIDRATFDEPFTPPGGVRYVFVNGAAAVAEGRATGSRSGRMLSR